MSKLWTEHSSWTLLGGVRHLEFRTWQRAWQRDRSRDITCHAFTQRGHTSLEAHAIIANTFGHRQSVPCWELYITQRLSLVSEGSKEVANIAVIIINPSQFQTLAAFEGKHESVLHWTLPRHSLSLSLLAPIKLNLNCFPQIYATIDLWNFLRFIQPRVRNFIGEPFYLQNVELD